MELEQIIDLYDLRVNEGNTSYARKELIQSLKNWAKKEEKKLCGNK